MIDQEAMTCFNHLSLSIHNLALDSKYSGKQPLDWKSAMSSSLGIWDRDSMFVSSFIFVTRFLTYCLKCFIKC